MKGILELARKDLTILRRDRPSLFWTFGWPLVFALFFGFLMSGSGPRGRSPMSVALVDEAGTAASRRLAERLAASPALRLEPLGLDEARDAVRRGQKVAFVLVPRGFGADYSLFRPGGPALRLGVDPSRQAEAGMLRGVLAQASSEIMQDELRNTSGRSAWLGRLDTLAVAGQIPIPLAGRLRRLFAALDTLQAGTDSSAGPVAGGFGPPRVEEEPIERDQLGRPRSSFDITFPAAILWALLSCASGFAVSLVLERQDGTLLRLASSPLGRWDILLGKATACFFACLAVSTLLLLLGVAIFHVRVGSVLGVTAALVASGLCFTGLMMAFSAAGRTPRAVAGVSWAVMLPLAMLGGGMVPLIAMPEWMQTVSGVSPVKWAVLAIEGAVWRDFTAAEMWVPLAILLAIGTLAFVLGARLFHASEA